MRFASLLAALLLTYSASSSAGPKLWNGNQLLRYYQAYESVVAKREKSPDLAGFALYLGYVRGSYEVLQTSPQSAMCVDNSYTIEMLARVVGRYLEQHPQELNLPASFLVTKSLKVAFPCK